MLGPLPSFQMEGGAIQITAGSIVDFDYPHLVARAPLAAGSLLQESRTCVYPRCESWIFGVFYSVIRRYRMRQIRV